jgi:hypothetical protein
MMRDATEKAILFALSHSNAVNDTGLSPSDVQDMIGGWGANMQAVQQYLPTYSGQSQYIIQHLSPSNCPWKSRWSYLWAKSCPWMLLGLFLTYLHLLA